MEANSPRLEADPELEALRLWIALRPRLQPAREVEVAELGRCARVLTEPRSDDAEILSALVVLAQSPVRQAGEALWRYAANPHPGFGHLATQAWEEWQFWSPAPLRRVA